MFWKKKTLDSREYLELKKELALLWLEVDVLSLRYKRKAMKKETLDVPEEGKGFNDGFNDLRKLNKEQGLS